MLSASGGRRYFGVTGKGEHRTLFRLEKVKYQIGKKIGQASTALVWGVGKKKKPKLLGSFWGGWTGERRGFCLDAGSWESGRWRAEASVGVMT